VEFPVGMRSSLRFLLLSSLIHSVNAPESGKLNVQSHLAGCLLWTCLVVPIIRVHISDHRLVIINRGTATRSPAN
jgi:hypothetical protein